MRALGMLSQIAALIVFLIALRGAHHYRVDMVAVGLALLTAGLILRP